MRVRVGSGLSQLEQGAAAGRAALADALAPLGGESPDLVLLFVSPHFSGELRSLVDTVADAIDDAPLLGCAAGGIIGPTAEVEDAPAVAIWAAVLPGARISPFRLTFRRTEEHAFIEGMDEIPSDAAAPLVLLFGDPYSFPADLLLDHLNVASPGVPVIGGMASGGLEAGRNRLFLSGRILSDGAIGAVITGLPARSVVSQGCRPIGETFAVTRADDNVILELGGQPAVRRLEELYASAGERDRLLLRRGLHVGQAITELKPDLGRGDFVIRNVVGIDRRNGALAISDVARVGQTVQFQVRDAESAREDLRELLAADRGAQDGPVAGALLFSCNGRGQALFGQPDHDLGALRRAFGQVPVVGFFAAGELGPVGGRNFLHGLTASVLILPAETATAL